MPFTYPNQEERILANSTASDEHWFMGTPCWVWLGKLNNGGYGELTMRVKGRKVHVLAHRWSVFVFRGTKLRKGQVVMHRCNNTWCCNPQHLLPGTQRKNVRQCVAQGRHKSPFGRKV